jgi:hypothetical protein
VYIRQSGIEELTQVRIDEGMDMALALEEIMILYFILTLRSAVFKGRQAFSRPKWQTATTAPHCPIIRSTPFTSPPTPSQPLSSLRLGLLLRGSFCISVR